MRIIAGQWRGRVLSTVGKGDARAHLRPTTDRTRESLFSILLGGRYGDPITGAHVLDLFAGTGALGLEALSRGADFATFVENGRVSQNLIASNIKLCNATAAAQIVRRDAHKIGSNPGAPCRLVFLDPPYGAGLGTLALATAQAGGWIAKDALIVWEESTAQTAPPGFDEIENRRFGDTWITFLRTAT